MTPVQGGPYNGVTTPNAQQTRPFNLPAAETFRLGKCDQCGIPLPASNRGRPRVHCSKACARKAERVRARLRAQIAEASELVEHHQARAGEFHRAMAERFMAEVAALTDELVAAS